MVNPGDIAGNVEKEDHRNRDRPRRHISKKSVIGNALNINSSCLEMKLKAKSNGSGDVRLSLRLAKKLILRLVIQT